MKRLVSRIRSVALLSLALTAAALVQAQVITYGSPIVVAGKIVGAIGTSGGSAAQDGQVAQAGIAALK